MVPPFQTLSCYRLFCYVSLANKIENGQRQFWWKHTLICKRGLCDKSLKDIYTPTEVGAVDIKLIHILSEASLAKLAWRTLFDPNSLVAKF